MTPHPTLDPRLCALLEAECAAEAAAHPGTEAADLWQDVWLRWFEHVHRHGPPADPAGWLRCAVRTQVRSARRRQRSEVPVAPVRVPQQRRVTAADGRSDPVSEAEAPLLAAERRRDLAAAVAQLPRRCPSVLRALLDGQDLTYPEIARELGISQGSVGPLRSRCLECLRRMLTAEVAPPGLRGRVERQPASPGQTARARHPRTRVPAHTIWGGMRTWA